MTYSFIRFGVELDDLDRARDLLEKKLGVKFRGHRAVDHNIHMRTPYDVEPRLMLKPNAFTDHRDGPDMYQPEFPQYPLLLEIYGFKERKSLTEDVLSISELKAAVLHTAVE